jgi:predicted nucleic acid-binding protein
MIVCLDTNIVIYYVGNHPDWAPKVHARLTELMDSGDSLAVSDAARLECLVGPVRSKDNLILSDYRTFFALPEVRMLPVTPSVWERAAEIRATIRFSALDSIHLATAIEHACGRFLTSDAQLSRLTAISVEVLT